MNVDELVFFNKEGYAMNMNRDPDFGYWYAKMYFDKNSVDTYKSLGIYLFEKTLPTHNTFQAYLDKFQAFNTDGVYTWPSNDVGSLDISDIKKTNNSNQFFTKWIYLTGIDARIKPGQWLYFNGLNGFLSTDFDTSIGGQQHLFQILQVQSDRVMVRTAQNNSVALPAFVPGPTKHVTIVDVIEHDIDVSPPSWQEASGMTKIYSGKKMTMAIGAEDDGVFTSNGRSIPKTKRYYTFSSSIPSYTPSLGDFLRFKINLFTDRLQISNGTTIFAPITSPNAIQVPYIPFFLKAGDHIIAQQKTVALFGPNTATFTVTGIDKTSNQISVTPAPTLQTVDCYVYLATNQIVIDQDIVLDNNNSLSVAVTYWSVVNKWKSVLNGYDIGLEYVPATDSIKLEHLYAENYFNTTLEARSQSGTLLAGPVSPSITNLNVYPYWVKENLTTEEEISPDASLYTRRFVFNTIDSEGIRLRINKKDYNVDYDTSVSNTTTDWISQFATTLSTLGIQAALTTTYSPNDTIQISPDFPNRPVFIESFMGDFSDWWVEYKEYLFSNIKTQLLINVNGTDYKVPFTVSDAATVTSWLSTHLATLATLGIYVATNGPGTVQFRVRDPERTLKISYNIGYIPKSGDTSVVETNLAPKNSGGILTGNEIKTVTGTYDFFQLYSTGQKISIDGAVKLPQNVSYNVIGLSSDTLCLSYQGAFWQQGLPLFSLNVNSDFFLQQPKQGLSFLDKPSVLRWSWKDTQNDDIFLYDFSGDQLKPIYPGFPPYDGVLPLCGTDGSIEIKLNLKPNDDIDLTSDPTKQQTVFDLIENTLDYTDSSDDVLVEPTPIQIYAGYRSKIDSFTRSRLYCELVEDMSFALATQSNLFDNLWNFSDVTNSLTITSPLLPFDFQQLGFKVGQVIEIASTDISTDNRKIVTLLNQGKKFTITKVTMHSLFFKEAVISETSVKVIPKTTAPFYDAFGNQLTESRWMSVSIKVMPKLIAYFDLYGESEDEDERHKINLNNRNLNILKLQDFYIFKEVDIKEKGIDWVFLNRKRKQLLEIYGEVFNYVSSYKAIIQAINFFGYNDLTFTEYFQNVDPDNTRFGQLFNMEILNIFDKSVKGWSYSNLAIENLRNEGYRKTNLFSLNYLITDRDGNFVNAYSLEEVQIKLAGLRKWLSDNLVPMGAKIVDINGKYFQPVKWHILHDTYRTKKFRIEEYSTPVDFKVNGHLLPVTTGSDQYNISVLPFSASTIAWCEIRVRTFYLDYWITSNIYTPGDVVYWNGFVWTTGSNVGAAQEPGVSNLWVQTTLTDLQCNQVLRDFRHNDLPFSFTINKLVDPHFIVEINWHSDYACALTVRKTYSVIPNFFDNLKV